MADIVDILKEKYKVGMVIGITPSGELEINMTDPSFPGASWLLSKALFEVHLLEKEMEHKNKEKGPEVETSDPQPSNTNSTKKKSSK